MQGLHLTADLYGCQCESALMTDATTLAELCRRAVQASGLTLVDEKYHTFPEWQGQPGGVTGAVLLAESHLAVHTWPERAGVTLDVYVCNFSTDNSSKAEHLLNDLMATFAPQQCITNRILRGSKDPETRSDELLLEWLNDHGAYGFKATQRLETLRTRYQQLEVFETPQWGRLLRLDGRYMTSERDEFFYHEPMVHVAAIAIEQPRSVLVIGGGDGGSAEELFKHPSIERVVLAELDADVVEMSRKYLGSIHRGSLDDPRLQVRIGDGAAYVAEQAGRADGERFDLVVLDLTDPDTPAHQLYTREFFAQVKQLLTPQGAVTLHISSPIFTPERVRQLTTSLRSVFSIVRPYGAYVPLYGTYWGMACASDTVDPVRLPPAEVERRLAERGVRDLKYYNGDVHQALFALPNYYRDLVQG
ncbi:polyamine aminopropyltransferase [Caldimonas thermodepolymerans]|uniref:Polyamine aminopropyltransferase n=2 Tax=Caldimonas thermodepolymerans TaxID=215580 RepID=A0AA46DBQ7_9BURK|nr:polyamine aminopropyltransferase [Caldimonas thermodepolymerans]TCP05821.1 spermidine synthase [Caldimonas thermodepolymerans]UZG48238.1 polyamine aminopropyltransferase [Caldimonas thermodepolymerans]